MYNKRETDFTISSLSPIFYDFALIFVLLPRCHSFVIPFVVYCSPSHLSCYLFAHCCIFIFICFLFFFSFVFVFVTSLQQPFILLCVFVCFIFILYRNGEFFVSLTTFYHLVVVHFTYLEILCRNAGALALPLKTPEETNK